MKHYIAALSFWGAAACSVVPCLACAPAQPPPPAVPEEVRSAFANQEQKLIWLNQQLTALQQRQASTEQQVGTAVRDLMARVEQLQSDQIALIERLKKAEAKAAEASATAESLQAAPAKPSVATRPSDEVKRLEKKMEANQTALMDTLGRLEKLFNDKQGRRIGPGDTKLVFE